jgi:hypothetical protein
MRRKVNTALIQMSAGSPVASNAKLKFLDTNRSGFPSRQSLMIPLDDASVDGWQYQKNKIPSIAAKNALLSYRSEVFMAEVLTFPLPSHLRCRCNVA